MAGVFDEILTSGVRSGQVPSRTQNAREWYRTRAQEYGREGPRINEKRFVNGEQGRLRVQPKPGHMYMYLYDPKTKDTLPYYDRFPLIFPFRVESDRFWGINLHYLPLPYRATLMDGLYDITNNNRFDESTKLRLSYQVLNSASKFRYFKPCIKQYLFNQMQSKFVYVYPSEWDIALFLPLERFAKASKSQVWSATRKLVSENR
jgi:hypothetical protein